MDYEKTENFLFLNVFWPCNTKQQPKHICNKARTDIWESSIEWSTKVCVNDLGVEALFQDDAGSGERSDDDDEEEDPAVVLPVPFMQRHISSKTLRFIGYQE